MFYCFTQNNSWGKFENNADKGICDYVIVEAANADDANARAQEIGIYFNGVLEANDCPCCGARWYPADDCDGTETPQINNTPIHLIKKRRWLYYEGCFVHYLTGDFEFTEFPNA